MKKGILPMKKTVRFLGLVAFAVIIGFTLTTCDNDAASGGSGTITISIGSSTGAAVSASGWTLGVAPNLLVHTITIIDGDGARHEQTGVGYGSVVSFAVAGGQSRIGVWALHGGSVVAYGFTTYNVTSGRSAVAVHMGTPEGAPPVGQPGPRTTPEIPHTHSWGVWSLRVTGTPWSSYEGRTCTICGATEERTAAIPATPGLDYTPWWGDPGWSVSSGTVTSGTVVIPHYFRLTASDTYSPVTMVTGFDGTSITNVTIPASVTHISSGAFGSAGFGGNTNLHTVIFAPGSTLQTIGVQAFFGSGLTSIEIPASVISIGDHAFWGTTSLGTVIFAPDSMLTTIGDLAFGGTSITSIIIPASVTSMGENVFWGWSSAQTITVPWAAGFPPAGWDLQWVGPGPAWNPPGSPPGMPTIIHTP